MAVTLALAWAACVAAVAHKWQVPTDTPRQRVVLLATAVGGAVVLAVLFRRKLRLVVREQRADAGECPGCGYDLRAGHDRCPECGAVVRRRGEEDGGDDDGQTER